LLQVGVNAPGTPNRTTFLAPNTSAVDSSFGPSAVRVLKVASGSFWPTAMVMLHLVRKGWLGGVNGKRYRFARAMAMRAGAAGVLTIPSDCKKR